VAQEKCDNFSVKAKYKLAIERCEALSGDAKTACTATAKTDAGKN
jgi:hypothetical protein